MELIQSGTIRCKTKINKIKFIHAGCINGFILEIPELTEKGYLIEALKIYLPPGLTCSKP